MAQIRVRLCGSLLVQVNGLKLQLVEILFSAIIIGLFIYYITTCTHPHAAHKTVIQKIYII